MLEFKTINIIKPNDEILMKEHFYVDGIISCPYFEDNNLVDILVLIPKTEVQKIQKRS